MEGNLTKGPILKTLTKLAIPIMASSFLGTLYNITDMAWIGLLGSKAVAGVGVGGMFTWFSQGLASMSRMGGQVQVAQCIGRGDKEEAHKYAQTAVQLATLMGLLFATVMLLFLNPLVGFFQLQDPEALQAALSYTKIACGLIVFSFLTLTLTGIYTAQGDSKTPFIANFIGLVTNMILDPLLILGLGPVNKFGVNGAAIATVSAQAIVMTILILGIIRQKKQNVLKGIKLFTKIPFKYLSGICKIGIPTAIQGMVYCGISMVLTRMVSGFGAEAVAVQRVGGQIESVSWNTADGFGTALNAFIGQNYGAGKMDRVKKGYKASLCSVGIWGIFITIIFVFQPKAIAEIFFHEPKAIMIAIGYLTIIGVSEAFMAVELMTVGALSGLGKTHLCSVISILFTSARIPLAIILGGALLGLEGIWWAFSVTSIVKGIIFVCPDGKNSWYWDSPKNQAYRYETFVASELVKHTDKNYATIPEKKGRAITGLSMGGHGALWLAIRHKEIFGAGGSTSGGVDIRPFPKNWEMNKQLGDYESDKTLWDQHTVITQVDKIKDGDLALIIDCGEQDFFLEVNKALHKMLLEKNISHDFITRPGGHNGQYWNNSIDYQILFFDKFFKK